MLILVFLLFSSVDLRQISGATTDTLTLGQSLPWNETLVSKGGNFELGLFSPGKSKKHYIGIWFRKVSKQTVVWVANRDRPILEPSASRFTLSDRGELLLHATPSNTLLWSSNASSPSPPRTTVATLQDDGNLVVRSNASASSSVAWQSFDHPTDTWLPGARLGYDRARGVHSFLTSWTDSENPAPATFSMEIDQRGQAKFDLLAGGTHQYWTTGVWDGEVFENVPEMRSGYFDGVPYAPNASVNFFSYKNRVPGIGNFVLEVNGQMQRRQWSPEAGKWILFCSEPHDGCDVYGSCGPFGVCRNTSSAMCECPAAFAPRSRGVETGEHGLRVREADQTGLSQRRLPEAAVRRGASGRLGRGGRSPERQDVCSLLPARLLLHCLRLRRSEVLGVEGRARQPEDTPWRSRHRGGCCSSRPCRSLGGATACGASFLEEVNGDH
ncbi:unnamed protein product [Miscanthus lutarioriparius]|uniref:non-specific serine/threonine protein kinase n=1 Tax=Miscanthus lutarioriparius TaxID=422564 RepID=A0A811MMY8_9POAL|nr:unnamed protein product [Miscanthus lutarioriparius]